MLARGGKHTGSTESTTAKKAVASTAAPTTTPTPTTEEFDCLDLEGGKWSDEKTAWCRESGGVQMLARGGKHTGSTESTTANKAPTSTEAPTTTPTPTTTTEALTTTTEQTSTTTETTTAEAFTTTAASTTPAPTPAPTTTTKALVRPRTTAAPSTPVCAETDTAYNPIDMPMSMLSVEVSPVACQRRCAQTEGCAHFSFWSSLDHCHLQDASAVRETIAGFTAGGPRCSKEKPTQPSAGSCFNKAGGAFFPLDLSGSAGTWTASAAECQTSCQAHDDCARFSWYAPTSTCHLADGTAALSAALPDVYYVTGPRRCDTAGVASAEQKFAQVDSPLVQHLGIRLASAVAGISAFVAFVGGVAVAWRSVPRVRGASASARRLLSPSARSLLSPVEGGEDLEGPCPAE